MLGEVGKGFTQVMQGFDFSRALIGLQCVGTAQQTVDETWEYVSQREAFDRPISKNQGVSFPLAESETLLTAARLLCYQTLWLKDAGLPHTSQAAMCKWWAPEDRLRRHQQLPAAARPVRVPHREAHRAATAGRPRPADR